MARMKLVWFSRPATARPLWAAKRWAPTEASVSIMPLWTPPWTMP